MDDQEKSQMIRGLQEQAAIMKAFAKISHNCFMKCVGKPGKALSSTEDACLTNCVERHGDMSEFLMERLQSLAQKEHEKQGLQ